MSAKSYFVLILTHSGYLEKMDMTPEYASIVLPTYYDSVSEAVSTGGGFKFGTTSVLSLYVCHN